jgi:hypothetical protein
MRHAKTTHRNHSPFRYVSGELIKSSVELINSEASFDDRRTFRNDFKEYGREIARGPLQ